MARRRQHRSMPQQYNWEYLRDTPYFGFIYPVEQDSPLLRQLLDSYVLPFYKGMTVNCTTPEFVAACTEITPDDSLLLLQSKSWRTCMVAAHFIAIRKMFEVQTEFSSHFLESEIQLIEMVARYYCAALARFGNEEAVETLFYFIRSNPRFTREMAMAALIHSGVKPSSKLSAEWIEPYKVAGSSERERLRHSLSWMRQHLATTEKAEQMLREARR